VRFHRVGIARLAIVLAALGLWEGLAQARDPLLYVPPSRALPALGRLLLLQSFPALPEHLSLTLVEIGAAYALAAGGGIAAGFVLGLRPFLGRAYAPLLGALYAVPSVVWYPSLMLLLGLGAASKVAFGALLGFYPVVVAVLSGMRQVEPQLVTVARAFGAGRAALFARVMLPAMLSTLVSGLRAGLALSVVGVIVGEVLGSRAGLGYLINYAYGLLRTADYVALVILTGILVAALDGLAGLVERRSRRWA
jgi:ABC-type nitrate/sulfonate/bicarbonate transport system permease component